MAFANHPRVTAVAFNIDERIEQVCDEIMALHASVLHPSFVERFRLLSVEEQGEMIDALHEIMSALRYILHVDEWRSEYDRLRAQARERSVRRALNR